MLASNLPPSSPLVLALSDGKAVWGLPEMLAAAAVDELRGANWQRGGGKGQRPKPITRPGVGAQTERIGGRTTYSTEQMRRLLDASRN